MAQPAVQGDMVVGNPAEGTGCLPGSHQMVGPFGAPTPNPAPLPFAGMLNKDVITTVTIGGRPVAVVGSKGDTTAPHPGLHASDPAQMLPMRQVGEVMTGSPTVFFGGQAAATSNSMVKTCGGIAKLKCMTMNVTVA
jgi:uncharacterized Zn-binding protein involved in type VI secretion